VGDSWDETDVWTQAKLIAYNQVREYEDAKFQIALAGAKRSNAEI